MKINLFLSIISLKYSKKNIKNTHFLFQIQYKTITQVLTAIPNCLKTDPLNDSKCIECD